MSQTPPTGEATDQENGKPTQKDTPSGTENQGTTNKAKFAIPSPRYMAVLKDIKAAREEEIAAHPGVKYQGEKHEEEEEEGDMDDMEALSPSGEDEDAVDLGQPVTGRSMLNPSLLKAFAYSGRAWKMEIVTGIVVATAGIIILIVGLIRQGYNDRSSFIMAGSIVFCIGFLFLFRAFFWYLNHRSVKKQTRYVEHHLLPSYENGAAAIPQIITTDPTPV